MKYIKPIKIGRLDIKNNVFLAPMAGITGMPFRVLCKEQGVGMVYSEMVSAKGLFYNDKKTHMLLKTHICERPIVLQLFGRDPEIIKEVIENMDLKNFDMIDLNFGCPAPKVVKNGEGSALMREPELLMSITKAVVKVSPVPVTVKIRRGWDEKNENAVSIACLAEEAGADAIVVHGRYSKQFYSGKANWEIIRKIKEKVSIPVIGNGDIIDYKSMKKMIDETGCDAVMIGRGAKGCPWISSSILNMEESNKKPSEIEIFEMIEKQYDILFTLKDEYIAVREMHKHISWYLKGTRNAAHLRNAVFKCDKMIDVLKILRKSLQEV